jgi:cold shock CspA family protein
MTTGFVKWFDDKTGEGRIVASGREYPVRREDLERSARVPKARVRFDIRRLRGVAHAVRGRLIPGTRTSPKQGRFGDLVGASHPNEKGRAPLTHRHPDREAPLRGPVEMAKRWVEAMEESDLDAAARLYAADARLHASGRLFTGRAAVQEYLGASRLLGMQPLFLQIHGDRDVRIDWAATGPLPAGETRLRVSHHEIVEQWISLRGPTGG